MVAVEASIQAVDQAVPNGAASALDRIRTRLLDLTNRNRLLNFRHPKASCLRAVDVAIDPIYLRLRDGERVTVVPVPEPELDGEPPSAQDQAARLGWNISLDLDSSGNRGGRFLPALYYQTHLDALARKMAAAAKTAIEESGMNMLYLIFGFLEWFESDDSNQSHLAPLVAFPVTIDRVKGKTANGGAFEVVLEHSGDDVGPNLCLIEKMQREFGIELPQMEDDETPEAFFGRLQDSVKAKRKWRIRRQITLSLLSFGKLLMYRDLNPASWPADESIAAHPLVKALLEGSRQGRVERAEEFNIDDPELESEVPELIRDADSSQHSALIHALSGRNLVLEGPPGTGKSQTITNLIAAALARGKTVLFVAEKLAALQVVRDRLDQAGLGTFCLEVHSHKTKKGALIQDLARRHEARGTFADPLDLDRQLALVKEKKQLLSEYAALVNRTIQPLQATVFDIFWARDRCGQLIGDQQSCLTAVILPAVVQFTKTELVQSEQFLAIYAAHLDLILAGDSRIEQHPWSWLDRPLTFQEEEATLGLLADFLAEARRVDRCRFNLADVTGIEFSASAEHVARARSIVKALPAPGAQVSSDLLSKCRFEANRKGFATFVGLVKRYQTNISKLHSFVGDSANSLVGSDIEQLSQKVESLRELGVLGLLSKLAERGRDRP